MWAIASHGREEPHIVSYFISMSTVEHTEHHKGSIILVTQPIPLEHLLINASFELGPSYSSSIVPNASASGCMKKLDKGIL